MPLSIVQPSGGVYSSLDAGGTSAAPAANTLICDSGALAGAAGQATAYKIVVVTYQVGTPDTNQANILVNIGGTNTAGIISGGLTIGKLQSNPIQSQQIFRAIVSSGQHIYICTGNAVGGAGAIYTAAMSVTRLPSLYAIP